MLAGLKGSDAAAACLSSPDGELHLRVESAAKYNNLNSKNVHCITIGVALNWPLSSYVALSEMILIHRQLRRLEMYSLRLGFQPNS